MNNDRSIFVIMNIVGAVVGIIIFHISLLFLTPTIIETEIITTIFHWNELFFVILALASGAIGGLVANIFFPKNYYVVILCALLVFLFAYLDIPYASMVNFVTR